MKNKNILFSTDGILGYKENVEEILKEKFNIVEYIGNYFPLKSERTLYFKILREIAKKSKIAKEMYKKYVEKYYCNMLDKYKNIKFDYFLVVAGQEFSKEFIQELKRRNTKIKCILFLWDKLEYTTLANSVDEFDYIFSFDPDDCKKYGFIFRPIFYTKDCENATIEYKKRKYALFYVGALREEKRYDIVNRFYEYCVLNKLEYFLKLITNQKRVDLNTKILSTEKISYSRNRELLKNSKVVLDLSFSNQSGLTIRASEALGTKTKLITTNKYIKNYDFYNKENIFFIDKIQDIELIPKSFFINEYVDVDNEVKQKYTTMGFIEEIFREVEGGN